MDRFGNSSEDEPLTITSVGCIESPHLSFGGKEERMHVVKMRTVCMPEQEDEKEPEFTPVRYLLYQKKPSIWSGDEHMADVTVSAFPTSELLNQWCREIREHGALAVGDLGAQIPFCEIPMGPEDDTPVGELFSPTKSKPIIVRKDGRVVRRYEPEHGEGRKYEETIMADTLMGGGMEVDDAPASKTISDSEKHWKLTRAAHVWCLYPHATRDLERLLGQALLEFTNDPTVITVGVAHELYNMGRTRWESEKEQSDMHIPCVCITMCKPQILERQTLRNLHVGIKYVCPCNSEHELYK